MPSSIINSDDGVISGTSGLKSTGGDDGVLKLQTKGTDAVTVNATQVVSLANALPAGSGGTGANTLTAEAVIIGNGTSAVKFVAAGTSGNVLTSNGTAWVSEALASASDYVMNVYTTPGTWTKPAGLKAIRVTVIGGGGGSGGQGSVGNGGGGGGTAIEYIDAPAIPGPQPYTVGTGGTAGASPGPSIGGTGNTSSFGGPTAFLSATGGSGGNAIPANNIVIRGGVGSNGQLNIAGGDAFNTSPVTPGSCAGYYIGQGGGTIFGGTNSIVSPSSNLTTPSPGTPKGYGVGSVGSTGPGPGVAGGTGVVIVEEFY